MPPTTSKKPPTARPRESKIQRSTRAMAIANKTAHSFVPGLGYLRHMNALKPGVAINDANACNPPATFKNGDRALLQPRMGGKLVIFAWVAAERAWERPFGNRMAWTAVYLASHGWKYVGVAPAVKAA
jgi:hypothetical protein